MRRIFVVIIFVFAIYPLQDVFAYGIDTHAALTQEIIDFYNKDFSQKKIPDNLKDFLIDGSRREDDGLRSYNHFYDPVYNRGLDDSLYGKGYASRVWARDSGKQNEFKYKAGSIIASILTAFQEKKLSLVSSESDYTWQKAIEYYASGEMEKSMFALGHVIHLIEDVSVPAHTRNDGHPEFLGDGDPYELWAYRFNQSNIHQSVEKLLEGKEPVILNDLSSYFNSMATYSNNNFYSGDTIGIQSGYDKPEPDYFKYEGEVPFGVKIDSEFGDYYLIQANGVLAWSINTNQLLEFPKILNDSWSRLSTKTIQHSAGVINLFFQEAEKAKADFQKEKERKSFLGQLADSVGNFVSGLFGSGRPDAVIPVGNEKENFDDQLLDKDKKETEDQSKKAVVVSDCVFETNQRPSRKSVIINEVAWMGGPGDPNAEWIELKNVSASDVDISGFQIIDQAEQIKFTFQKDSIPAGGFRLLERNKDYTGPLSNTNEGLRIFDPKCGLLDEALANPSWPAGDNNTKQTMERKNDLSWQTSAVAGGTPNKENSEPKKSEAATSTVVEDDEIDQTDKTNQTNQTDQTNKSDKTDKANQSSLTNQSKACAYAVTQTPTRQKIIINEVAWMGAASDANDEWIELKNISGQVLDVGGFQLVDKAEQIKISFGSGVKIPAGGFYLLERTDDNSVPNIAADKIYSGALANSDEGLRLFDSQCDLFDEAIAAPAWPAGDNSGKQTMERKSDFSWQTSAVQGGTPKSENSAGFVSSSGGNSNSSGNQATQNNPQNQNNPTSTPGIGAGHVVLSEIYPDKTGHNYDFVELYNPENSAANLSDYSLRILRESVTSSESLASFSGEASIQIPAKGFYLVGFDKYNESGNKTADVFRSSKSLPSTQSAKIIFQRSETVIDEYQYDAASLNDGQSFERKAYESGLCVSSGDSGEFSGNGCDNDNSIDWVVRSSANPQNSQSLPEPRTAPAAVSNFNLNYHFSAPALTMNWNDSQTGVSYRIDEINSSSSAPLNFTATSTALERRIYEINRPYEISVKAVDADGLASAVATSTVTVPSFLNSAYFYPDSRAGASRYLVELYYNNYPFIPNAYQDSGEYWRAIVFYLNSNADLSEDELRTAGNWTPANTGRLLALDHNQCAGGNTVRYSLILPDGAGRCGIGGGLNNSSFEFGRLEDKHLLLKTASSTADIGFGAGDHLTLAFYSFSDSGGGNQTLKLVAVDQAKRLFQNSLPAHNPPVFASGSLAFDFNSGASQLTVSWPSASDSDTVSAETVFEINVSTSTEFSGSAWSSVGIATSAPVAVLPGNQYLIGVRVRDDFGLTSEILSSNWTYPAATLVLDQSQGDAASSQWGTLPGACNYGTESCYDSRSLQSLQFNNNVSFNRAGVKISRATGAHTANIRLAVYSDSGGRPDYSSLLASAGVTDVLDPAGEETIFTFGSPVALSANTTYWLALEVTTYSNGGSGFKSNSFTNVLSSGNTITGGQAAFRPASFGDLQFQADPARDWYLKLYQ